ncbi:hypothetical protein ABI_05520 [Asticcacaulis biprosthecium C19]|uniref:Uncharacterized protein n=1 Tax=Asticcacaulis biprosthecium C19 TaxID=715226 RepID=F4QKG6_9CAUL|nr:hypothetical protein ABI_05520 [Asticcacaulis biprosthecium C19]
MHCRPSHRFAVPLPVNGAGEPWKSPSDLRVVQSTCCGAMP